MYWLRRILLVLTLVVIGICLLKVQFTIIGLLFITIPILVYLPITIYINAYGIDRYGPSEILVCGIMLSCLIIRMVVILQNQYGVIFN